MPGISRKYAVIARKRPGLVSAWHAQPGGAVRDLIVVLQKDDERLGRQIERRRAAPLASARRNAGPDRESRIWRRRRTRRARRGNRCNRPRAGRSARPSRCGGNRRSTARRARSRRAPAAAPGWRAAARSRRRQRSSRPPAASLHPPHDRGHDVVVRGVEDLLRRVEPQPVEMILVDPVAGIGEKELAHRLGCRARRN